MHTRNVQYTHSGGKRAFGVFQIPGNQTCIVVNPREIGYKCVVLIHLAPVSCFCEHTDAGCLLLRCDTVQPGTNDRKSLPRVMSTL